MSKTTNVDEIQMLRFFEQGPIEKVEVLFNIVTDKMGDRLCDRQSADADQSAEKPRSIKRRISTEQAPPLGLLEHSG